MTTIYIAWQDYQSRRWFPVGRLVYREANRPEFEFAYIRGARQAEQVAAFTRIPGFPDMNQLYKASVLFPAFRNRVMNMSRPDRPEYLSQLGININTWDELAELAVSGGRSHSDRFEAFPEIVPDEDGRFASRFILHGLRYTNPDSVRRTDSLEVDELLVLSFELNNPITEHAISVKTHDQYVLGWLPDYLVAAMHQDNAWMVNEIETRVAQVNRDAPLSHRLLVDFSGRLPKGVSPMRDLPDYDPIPADEVSRNFG